MVSSFIRCLHETQSVHVYTYQYHNDDIICSVVIDCGGLSNITNGMLSYSAQGQDQTLLGVTVTYTCNTGYTVNGSSMRTCLTDSAWSGSDPTCDGKYSVLQINEWPFIFLCNKLA